MTLISSRSPSHAALSAYTQPRIRRGLLDIATSAGAYLALCVAMYLMLRVSPLLVVALVVPTAGFLVRVFVVFHDCVHGSLLPSKRANTWAGTVLGLLVLTPFRPWRLEHLGHHASSGDLDRRGIGDVETLTVAEYQVLRSWSQRHPAKDWSLPHSRRPQKNAWRPAQVFSRREATGHRLPVVVARPVCRAVAYMVTGKPSALTVADWPRQTSSSLPVRTELWPERGWRGARSDRPRALGRFSGISRRNRCQGARHRQQQGEKQNDSHCKQQCHAMGNPSP